MPQPPRKPKPRPPPGSSHDAAPARQDLAANQPSRVPQPSARSAPDRPPSKARPPPGSPPTVSQAAPTPSTSTFDGRITPPTPLELESEPEPDAPVLVEPEAQPTNGTTSQPAKVSTRPAKVPAPSPDPVALHTPRARAQQPAGTCSGEPAATGPDGTSNDALAVPAPPDGGWLRTEDMDGYEPLVTRSLGTVNVAPGHHLVVWKGLECNAVCSNFRLMVGPPPGSHEAPPDRLSLPWLRIWRVERRDTMVTLLTKTGETHWLHPLRNSEAVAQAIVDNLQQKLREARVRSRLGTDRPFGSRPGTREPGARDGLGQTDVMALIMADYGRMGLTRCDKFRKYAKKDNEAGPELKSYPNFIFVPAAMNKHQLQEAAEFRGNHGSGRLPAVVWRHPATGVVISRSGQPRPGLRNERCASDETLLRMIAAAGPQFSDARGLTIFDARPKLNAAANMAKGGGYEDTSAQGGYNEHTIVFLDIGNIHKMRELLVSLSDELAALNRSNAGEATRAGWGSGPSGGAARAWLDCQAQILDGAAQIRDCLLAGRSCLIHCTDGWDRTPQLSATAQLLVDGYYRTIDGFVALVQREWLDFGHTFAKRMHGHDDFAHGSADGRVRERSASPEPDEKPNAKESSEFSPIFLQWIETVWQLLVQFPEAFEFTESLLMEVVDAAYSCEWTTFIGNSYLERVRHLSPQSAAAAGGEIHSVETEACFWHGRILSDAGRRRHGNILYLRSGPTSKLTGRDRVLWPCVASCKLRLWDGLHMSHHQAHLTPQLKAWPTEPGKHLQQLTRSSIERAAKLPGVPSTAVGTLKDDDDDMISPRTGGLIDDAADQKASLDISQIVVMEEAFYGTGEPEPESSSLSRSSSMEAAQTVELPPMILPACLDEDCKWAPDNARDTCTNCLVPWSTALRRHHCRLCGGLFCYNCAPNTPVAGTSVNTKAEAEAWSHAFATGGSDTTEQLAGGPTAGEAGDGTGAPSTLRAGGEVNLGQLRCCSSCSAVLALGGGEGCVDPRSERDVGSVLQRRWRSKLAEVEPRITEMQGIPRRPRNLGGAGPWLVQLLRGVAWGDSNAELLLEQLSEEVDFALTADARAAAAAVRCERAQKPPERQGEALIQGVGVAGEVVTDVIGGLSGLWRRATGSGD